MVPLWNGSIIMDFSKSGYIQVNTFFYEEKLNIYGVDANLICVDGGANKGGDWDNSKFALDIGGGIYGAMETTVAPGNQWLGQNGKYYDRSWGGNQYTGSRSGALNAASRFKVAGVATIVATAAIGGIETYSGYRKDGGQFGYNAQSAAAQTVGGIGGGVAGGVRCKSRGHN